MKNFSLLLLPLFLFSCSNNDDEQPQIHETITQIEQDIALNAEDSLVIFDADTLLGSYVGSFGKSEIRLILNFISETHAVGYNIHRGLQRNIAGLVTGKKDVVAFELNEPGDHEFDGVFHFTIDKKTFAVEGKWVANDEKLGEKTFKLKKVGTSKTFIPFEELKLSQITNANFTDYFDYVSDSIGNITFERSGLCTFSYYEKYDSKNFRDQLTTFTGNWSVNKGKLTVLWNKNKLFTEKACVMDIYINTEDYEIYLDHPKHRFYTNLMY